MTNLERSVASLQGVSMDARNTYLVAEAEYYLQIANAQLQLAGNPYLASLALDQADDRLLQVGDPALTDVRRAIADEAAALEIMEQPDVAGLSLTLASLARVVESLPLRTRPDAGEGFRGDHPVLVQSYERLGQGGGCRPAFVGDHVAGDVESGLDGQNQVEAHQLEGVAIRCQGLGTDRAAQPDALQSIRHFRQLDGHDIGVNHGRPPVCAGSRRAYARTRAGRARPGRSPARASSPRRPFDPGGREGRRARGT